MCGIYGSFAFSDAPLQDSERIEKMGSLLHHRGPDAHEVRFSPRMAMGAERLRIFDPTPAGDQPFVDPDARVWLVLNGAIYNAPELRGRYHDYPFKSRSDAESVLPLYLDAGESGIARLDGMFALAIYDERNDTLVLARDRAGEKPLFYSRIGSEIWFASEIQALLTLPRLNRDLDPSAVRDFVTLGYVTEPKTMFQAVRRVEAGTSLTFSCSGQREHRYWDPSDLSLAPEPATDLTTHLETLISAAVRKQLAADAPVGIFTSGGVDSSLIAAFACREIDPNSVRTFSVGFTETEFDEAPYARRLASFLGSEHSSIVADEKDLAEALGIIIRGVAEPSADPAILPTYLLSRAASLYVKVVLGGEGADELFGGYPTYLGHLLAPQFLRWPEFVRHAVERWSTHTPVSLESKVPIEYLVKRFVDGANLPVPDRHMEWFGTGAGSGVLNPDLLDDRYEPPPFPDAGDPIGRACRFDYGTYLRDNLLVKVDRATMLASIEARAPYLDRDVTAFAMALGSSLKVKGLTTKWLLKKVARRVLPRELVYRKKRGLSVPVATWLNGCLRPEAERLLNARRIERQGLLHPGNVRQLLSEHQSRRVNHGRALWALLMLEMWLERWVPERNR